MAELKKHDNIKVAVTINDSPFITLEEGILYEYVEENEALLYIKSKEGNREIKIKPKELYTVDLLYKNNKWFDRNGFTWDITYNNDIIDGEGSAAYLTLNDISESSCFSLSFLAHLYSPT